MNLWFCRSLQWIMISLIRTGLVIRNVSLHFSRLRVVVSLSIICNISNIAIVICFVVNMLGPAIRKLNRVGSFHVTMSITILIGIEIGAFVFIIYVVGVAVRSWLVWWLNIRA